MAIPSQIIMCKQKIVQLKKTIVYTEKSRLFPNFYKT